MSKRRICKNCKFREYKRHKTHGFYCQNPKLADDIGQDDVFRSDALLYEYSEGGGFLVGDNFGCIHFEVKQPEITSEKEPIEIAGFLFPPGTTVQSADRLRRLSVEGEWVALNGWEFKTPFLEPDSAIFEKEDLGEAAKEFYNWLDKRGFLKIHEANAKMTESEIEELRILEALQKRKDRLMMQEEYDRLKELLRLEFNELPVNEKDTVKQP